jgi:hypothetical protein
MTNSLIHHRSFRTRRIYDGSIRRPRTGADDNKSVGLLVNADNAFVLMGGLARYLAWNTVRRIMSKPSADLIITSYKYNKGPNGHAATLTSRVKG